MAANAVSLRRPAHAVEIARTSPTGRRMNGSWVRPEPVTLRIRSSPSWMYPGRWIRSRSQPRSGANSPASIWASMSGMSALIGVPEDAPSTGCRSCTSGSSRTPRTTSARPGAHPPRRSAGATPRRRRRRRSTRPAGRPPRARRAAAPARARTGQDVQVVGDLVRLDPDQRRRDPVHLAIDVLRRGAGHRGAEDVVHHGRVPPPERQAAADEVLPQARLRLVQAERRGLRDRRVLVLRVEPLVVEPVAGLVERRRQTPRTGRSRRSAS